MLTINCMTSSVLVLFCLCFVFWHLCFLSLSCFISLFWYCGIIQSFLTFLPSVLKLWKHWKVFTIKLTFKRFCFFLDRGKGRRKERDTSMFERNIDQLPLTSPQPGTWSTTKHEPSLESNRWPFRSQNGAQHTEPHQSGPIKLTSENCAIISIFQSKKKKSPNSNIGILTCISVFHSNLLSFY